MTMLENIKGMIKAKYGKVDNAPYLSESKLSTVNATWKGIANKINVNGVEYKIVANTLVRKTGQPSFEITRYENNYYMAMGIVYKELNKNVTPYQTREAIETILYRETI